MTSPYSPRETDFMFPGHQGGAYEPEAQKDWDELAASDPYGLREGPS